MERKQPQPNNGDKPMNPNELVDQNAGLQTQYDALQKEFLAREEELKQLRASKEDFEEFYNNAPCGYYSYDENGLFFKMNQTELDWLGYTEEEVIGKMHIQDILTETSTIYFYKYLPILRERGTVEQIESEHKTKDGRILPRLVYMKAIHDKEGAFIGVQGFIWDISDRKAMEDDLLKMSHQFQDIKERLTEKNVVLEKLNQEVKSLKEQKNLFVDVVVDNIKLPLHNILAHTNELITETSFSPEDRLNGLRKIYDELSKLSRYVNSYQVEQQYGKEEHPSLEFSKFNLSSQLVTILNRFEETAAKKNIHLNLEIFKEYWISSDKEYFTQIMDKLLTNIMEITPAGRQITASLHQEKDRYIIELTISSPPSGIELEGSQVTGGRMSPSKGISPEEEISSKSLDLELVNELAEKLGYEVIPHIRNQSGFIRISIPIV